MKKIVIPFTAEFQTTCKIDNGSIFKSDTFKITNDALPFEIAHGNDAYGDKIFLNIKEAHRNAIRFPHGKTRIELQNNNEVNVIQKFRLIGNDYVGEFETELCSATDDTNGRKVILFFIFSDAAHKYHEAVEISNKQIEDSKMKQVHADLDYIDSLTVDC